MINSTHRRTFCCLRFCTMFAAMIPTDFSYKGKPPILEYRMLKQYVKAEYKRMVTELQSFIRAKSDISLGNTFCQLMHDGCTLKNGIKVQSVGIQFIDPNFVANHVVCLCCRECKSNTGKSVSDFIKQISIEVAGKDLSDICKIAVQDRAALSVTTYLGIDEKESCDMHDGDKIG